MTDSVPRVGTPDQKNETPVMGWKRVGWPSLLPRLDRCSYYRRLPEDVEQITPELKSKAKEILLKYNLSTTDSGGDTDEDIRVDDRSGIHIPARPTLSIPIDWSDEKHESIRLATREIAEHVRHFTEATVYVEIISVDLMKTVYYGPVTDPTLIAQWDDVGKRVSHCLDSMEATRGCLSSLMLFNYGYNPDIDMNPPTVYIAVWDESDERGWHGVVSAVKDILRSLDGWRHVQVHIEINEGYNALFD